MALGGSVGRNDQNQASAKSRLFRPQGIRSAFGHCCASELARCALRGRLGSTCLGYGHGALRLAEVFMAYQFTDTTLA